MTSPTLDQSRHAPLFDASQFGERRIAVAGSPAGVWFLGTLLAKLGIINISIYCDEAERVRNLIVGSVSNAAGQSRCRVQILDQGLGLLDRYYAIFLLFLEPTRNTDLFRDLIGSMTGINVVVFPAMANGALVTHTLTPRTLEHVESVAGVRICQPIPSDHASLAFIAGVMVMRFVAYWSYATGVETGITNRRQRRIDYTIKSRHALDVLLHAAPLNALQGQRVDVIGAGAIGSHAALLLALRGASVVRIFDGDDVEPHNIPNQAFLLSQCGSNKARATEGLMRALAPGTSSVAVPRFAASDEGDLSGIVVLATDDMEFRHLLLEHLVRQNIPRLVVEMRMTDVSGTLSLAHTGHPEQIQEMRRDIPAASAGAGGGCHVLSTGPIALLTAGLAVIRLVDALARGITSRESWLTILDVGEVVIHR